MKLTALAGKNDAYMAYCTYLAIYSSVNACIKLTNEKRSFLISLAITIIYMNRPHNKKSSLLKHSSLHCVLIITSLLLCELPPC